MSKTLIPIAHLAGAQLVPSDKSQITVKGSQVSNGVVVVAATEGKMSLELQCNKDLPSCQVLGAGEYLMVRLPKNRGMYDCMNADIYPKSADSDNSTRIGEYCLTERK